MKISCALALVAPWAGAVQLHGLIDVRAVAVDASPSWLHAGMGKLRYDQSGVRLGQATFSLSGELFDSVGATVIANASDDRRGAMGVNEAWIGWNPVPTGPWKTRVKAGAFFPASSLELDYDSIGWTPSRTVSSSAINSWIGEELRTKGIELTMTRSGRMAGSPHDYGLLAALYGGNDETGTLLAWRGWTVSERITSLTEPLTLPDLPVYRRYGVISRQSRTIHPFREIDNRVGYYVGAHYAYRGRLELSALHYDNRADPLRVKDGQYSWTTRFNHLSARLRPGGGWELALQAMDGSTLMGRNAVNARFTSWFALASHPLGPGQATVRYDRFKVNEDDILPHDPNVEDGQALALAYAVDLAPSLSLVAELLEVRSTRPARTLIGIAPEQHERSFTASLRWQF